MLGGRNVVTITPTASGKTLCYNAPVLNAILQDPSTRALYLFPTKALAQDQLAELHTLSELVTRDSDLEIGVFTYDGDTPSDARRAIRGKAHVVLSNPDMLHAGILPHHPRWAKLFENLRFVVIDELHAYRGVFGSHLSNILRRLQRVCRHYGSDPVFICSSATIANPRELAEGLTGKPFELVDESGAPRGEKFFLFVNPPVVNAELGIRRSYLAETRRVALEFLKYQLQLIVFAQSRLSVELLTTYLKDAFHGPPGAADVIRGYRGGYLPNRRREIERGLREGQVRAVVSTNALELGIDIGALDVSVMAGYPGTIAATWQRAGRAGRRTTRSAAVLVASSAPIDQFIIRNPSYFFDASPEHALINPDNLHILLDHVKCAAFELPFGDDEGFGNENVQEILAVLAEEGFVHHADGQWNWTNESYPADAVSLRSVSSDNFVVIDATRDRRARDRRDRLHERAVHAARKGHLHRRRPALSGRAPGFRRAQGVRARGRVRLLHGRHHVHEGHDSRDVCRVGAVRLKPDATTAAGLGRLHDGIVVSGFSRTSDAPRGRSHGEVHVVSRVVGFKKIKFYTNENVGSGELGSARAADAHLVVLADDSLVDHGRAAVRRRRPARRRRRSRVCDAQHRAAPADVRSARHRALGRRWDARAGAATGARGPSEARSRRARALGGGAPSALSNASADTPARSPPSRTSSSTTTIRAASDSAGRCSRCTCCCSIARASSIAGCPCESGCPSCVGPEGNTGPHAKAVALRILDDLLLVFRHDVARRGSRPRLTDGF